MSSTNIPRFNVRSFMHANTRAVVRGDIVCAFLLALAMLCVITGRASAQISPAEFAARRDSLAARIDSGVVVAFGERTPVTDFGPFHQLPAFHYLTNYDEADAAFVLVARNGRAVHWLFVAPVDPRSAFYYGYRTDSATVARNNGLTARPFASLQTVLDSLAATKLPFYQLADFSAADFAGDDTLTRGRVTMKALGARFPELSINDGHAVVNRLRARKSPAELALIRKAAEISDAGHRAAMLLPEPRYEYELQGVVEAEFMKLGAARPSYGSIVGAGRNGTTLHYMKNRGPAKPGDLVVIDAGAEYEGYAADVTRTIPVSGKYTLAQREIYQLVRDAQAAAERNAAPGKLASVASDSSIAVRVKGLARLGLIENDTALFDPPWRADCVRSPRSCSQAQLWTIHGITHGLGLEVHDPAQFETGARTYRPGDAFTLEPGIYISSASLAVLPDTPRNRAFIASVKAAVARYENTGVRIEDDYIITSSGLERISHAPREIAEIEALMAKRGTRRIQP